MVMPWCCKFCGEMHSDADRICPTCNPDMYDPEIGGRLKDIVSRKVSNDLELLIDVIYETAKKRKEKKNENVDG